MIKSKFLLKRLHAPALLGALVLLFIDYFVTKEFKIESTYLLAVATLVLADFVFTILNKSGWLATISLTVLFFLCFYHLFMLLLFAWGYMFIGVNFPFIWFAAAVINTLLLITTSLKLSDRIQKR